MAATSLGKSLLRVVQYGSVLYCTLEFVADFVFVSMFEVQNLFISELIQSQACTTSTSHSTSDPLMKKRLRSGISRLSV